MAEEPASISGGEIVEGENEQKEPSLKEVFNMLKSMNSRLAYLEQSFEEEGSDRQSVGSDLEPGRSGTPSTSREGLNNDTATPSTSREGMNIDSAPEEAKDNCESEMNFTVKVPDMSPAEGHASCTEVLDMLERELVIEEENGPEVLAQLARIAKNRFTVRLTDTSLEEKGAKYQIPDNCREIRGPVLNEEVKDRYLTNTNAKKADEWIQNVQVLITRACAAVLTMSDKVHRTVTDVAGKGPLSMDAKALISQLNECLTANGDVMAFLGNAQQELTIRRRFQMRSSLPKEIQAICSAKLPHSDKLFGEDVERRVRSAREAYRATQNRGSAGHRFHPYRGGANRGTPHFLGQGRGYSPQQRGRPHTQRGRGRGYRK